MHLIHTLITSTAYRHATYLLWKVAGEHDGLNTTGQKAENK